MQVVAVRKILAIILCPISQVAFGTVSCDVRREASPDASITTSRRCKALRRVDASHL
jgi:hypothetical protein